MPSIVVILGFRCTLIDRSGGTSEIRVNRRDRRLLFEGDIDRGLRWSAGRFGFASFVLREASGSDQCFTQRAFFTLELIDLVKKRALDHPSHRSAADDDWMQNDLPCQIIETFL